MLTSLVPAPVGAGPVDDALASPPTPSFSIASCEPGDYPNAKPSSTQISWVDHDGDGALCLELDATSSSDDDHLLDHARCNGLREDPRGNEVRDYLWHLDDPDRNDLGFSSRPVTNLTFEDDSLTVAGADHNVTLTVWDHCGNEANLTRTITVYANQPPVISNISATCNGATCNFVGTVGDEAPSQLSSDPAENLTCTWELGNGSSSPWDCRADNPIEVTYPQDGFYNVTLNITDRGNATTTSTNLQVAAFALAPMAEFTRSCTVNGPDLDCTFDASNSTDEERRGADELAFAAQEDIASFYWDFGDGSNTTTTDATVDHTFPEGTFNVNLTIDDGDSRNSTDTTSTTITFDNTPTARVVGSCIEMNCTFSAVNSTDADNEAGVDGSGDGSFSFDWELGDGNTPTGTFVNHTYETAGTYQVNVTMTDEEGLTDTANVTVDAFPNPLHPVIRLECRELTCAGDARDSWSTDGTTSFQYDWNFNGTTIQNEVANFTFAAPGTYRIGFTLSTPDKMASITRNVTISTDNLEEDFDAVGSEWSLSGLWGTETTCGSVPDAPYLAFTEEQTQNIAVGQEDPSGTQTECSYEQDGAHNGSADLTVDTNASSMLNLSFQHRGQLTEKDTTDRGDHAQVTWRVPNGTWTPCTEEWNNTNPLPSSWTEVGCSVDLRTYSTLPGTVQFRFHVQADGFWDDHVGWFVDDLEVHRTAKSPIALAPSDKFLTDADEDGAEPVALDASASTNTPADQPLASYSWYNASGGLLGNTSVVNVSAHVGVNEYTLVVSDGRVNDTDTVVVEVNAPPTAELKATCTGRSCTFNASDSHDTGGITSYEWNLSDGTTATTSTPVLQHRFAGFGDVSATVTVTGDHGLQDSASATATLAPILSETFDGSSLPTGWTTGSDTADGTNLWHVDHHCDESPQGLNHLGFTSDSDCNYDVGRAEGWVRTPLVNLTGAYDVVLEFQQNRSIEGSPSHDIVTVEVVLPNGTVEEVASWSDATPAWENVNLDLGSYENLEVQIQFSFDTSDGQWNRYPGWFIDDIVVS